MVYAGNNTFWSCGYKYTSPNYSGVVSSSSDGGQSWTRHELYAGTQYGYVRALAVDPSNSDNLFAIGYANSAYILYKTTNGGTDWSEISPVGYTGTPYDMIINPTDSDRIAIASSSGLYATTDCGENWTKVTGSFTTVNELHQSDLFGGLVVATTSGVWIWEEWTGTPVHYGEDPAVANIKCVLEIEDYLFAGTSGSAAWRSFCGSAVEEETEFSLLSGGEISLSPNPISNGSASLEFSLPVSGFTTVIIYDLSGRAVQNVSSGNMTEGSNQLIVDTSSLAPGVYFTTVQSAGVNMSSRFVVSR